jgi:uncharacterized membrane protein
MNWRQRYRLRNYLQNSLWVLPALSIVVAWIAVSLLVRYEAGVGSQISMNRGTVLVIMSTIAGSTFTLIVLVSSAMLVAIQLASAQLTPRLIALFYQKPYQKVAFAVFVFTFTFSLMVLARIDESAPRIASYAAAAFFLLDILLFIVFIDSVGKRLRPSSAVSVVAFSGRSVIRAAYPEFERDEAAQTLSVKRMANDEKHRTVLSALDGTLLGFDMKGLVKLAERHACVLELVPEVGQYVAEGDPLFRIYDGGDGLSEIRLRNSVAKGDERTFEQDPLFAFRILVDIANKALSPAINDPTTAVLSIDQIHHLLRDVGKRNLGIGRAFGGTGQLRLIYRRPNWEDFVLLATTEIRHYGRDSIQVQRRLNAMLEELIEILPPHRLPILKKELALLIISSKRTFQDVDDQNLAVEGDLQGIGGSYDDDEN